MDVKGVNGIKIAKLKSQRMEFLHALSTELATSPGHTLFAHPVTEREAFFHMVRWNETISFALSVLRQCSRAMLPRLFLPDV